MSSKSVKSELLNYSLKDERIHLSDKKQISGLYNTRAEIEQSIAYIATFFSEVELKPTLIATRRV